MKNNENLSATLYALKELLSRIDSVGKTTQSEIKDGFSSELSSYLDKKNSAESLPFFSHTQVDKIPNEGFARLRFKNNLSYDAFVLDEQVMLFTYKQKEDVKESPEGILSKTQLLSKLSSLGFSKEDVLGPAKERETKNELPSIAESLNTFISDPNKHLLTEVGEPYLKKKKDDGDKLKLSLSLVESSGSHVWRSVISEGFSLLSKIKDSTLLPYTAILYKKELETMMDKFSSLLINNLEKDDPFFSLSPGKSKFTEESTILFLEGLKEDISALRGTSAKSELIEGMESFIKKPASKPSFRVVGVFPKEDIASTNHTEELNHLFNYKTFQRSLFRKDDDSVAIAFDKEKGIVINDTSLLPDRELVHHVEAFIEEEKKSIEGLDAFMQRPTSDDSISSVFGISSRKTEKRDPEMDIAMAATPYLGQVTENGETPFEFVNPFLPSEAKQPETPERKPLSSGSLFDFEEPVSVKEETAPETKTKSNDTIPEDIPTTVNELFPEDAEEEIDPFAEEEIIPEVKEDKSKDALVSKLLEESVSPKEDGALIFEDAFGDAFNIDIDSFDTPVSEKGDTHNESPDSEVSLDDILGFGESLGSSSISGGIEKAFSAPLDTFEPKLSGLSCFDKEVDETSPSLDNGGIKK